MTCFSRSSAIRHKPVSLGACHPERLTAGLKASSGGVPSTCSDPTRGLQPAAGADWTCMPCRSGRCFGLSLSLSCPTMKPRCHDPGILLRRHGHDCDGPRMYHHPCSTKKQKTKQQVASRLSRRSSCSQVSGPVQDCRGSDPRGGHQGSKIPLRIFPRPAHLRWTLVGFVIPSLCGGPLLLHLALGLQLQISGYRV